MEVGIVYGGDLPKDQPVQILRFANRVPLLYQQGACAVTKSIERTDWRRYGLEQRGGEGIPFGPAIIMVHVASTKVPFTSEAKEAIANIPEIQAEIELALKICGRSLKTHLNKKETQDQDQGQVRHRPGHPPAHRGEERQDRRQARARPLRDHNQDHERGLDR